MNLRYLQLAILLALFSCVNFEKQDAAKTDDSVGHTSDGTVQAHYKDGSVRAEIKYKDGKKEGVAKEYYPTGVLFREIEYKRGKKEGFAKRYYKSGKLYQLTPYVNDTIHGILKKYREDGKLSTEAPYVNGEPCYGLIEYTTQGKVKKNYPTIVVTPKNTLLKDGKYILRISMSDKSRNVEFFEGSLDSDGCPQMKDNIYASSRGVAELEFFLPMGAFMMKEFNFIARVKTIQGNYYVTRKKYNMAIENR